MRRWLRTIAAAFLAVGVLSVVIGMVVWQLLPYPDFEKFAAAFGDVAGSVFSALAFAGLIVTALMQWKELGLQREELRQTRKELAGSRAAQEGSEAALQAQVEVAQLTARLNAAVALKDVYDAEIEKLARLIEIDKDLDESIVRHKSQTEFDLLNKLRMDVIHELSELKNTLAGVVFQAPSVAPMVNFTDGSTATTDSANA